jgi:hypothetical protein
LSVRNDVLFQKEKNKKKAKHVLNEVKVKIKIQECFEEIVSLLKSLIEITALYADIYKLRIYTYKLI